MTAHRITNFLKQSSPSPTRPPLLLHDEKVGANFVREMIFFFFFYARTKVENRFTKIVREATSPKPDPALVLSLMPPTDGATVQQRTALQRLAAQERAAVEDMVCAFMQGKHDRLGTASPVRVLPLDICKHIADAAATYVVATNGCVCCPRACSRRGGDTCGVWAAERVEALTFPRACIARRALLPDFRSVAQAVRTVPDGSTVSILDGDYVETLPIIITRRITLQSSSYAAEATAARRLRFERGEEAAESRDRWAMEGARPEDAEAGLPAAQVPGGVGLVAEVASGVLLTGVPPTLGGVLAVGGGLGVGFGAGIEDGGDNGDHPTDAPEGGGDNVPNMAVSDGAGGVAGRQRDSALKSGWKNGMPKTPVTIRMFTQSEARKDPLLVVATRPPASVQVRGIAFMHLRSADGAGGTNTIPGAEQVAAAVGLADGTAAAAAAAGGVAIDAAVDEGEGATSDASGSSDDVSGVKGDADTKAQDDAMRQGGMGQSALAHADAQDTAPEDTRSRDAEVAVPVVDEHSVCQGSGSEGEKHREGGGGEGCAQGQDRPHCGRGRQRTREALSLESAGASRLCPPRSGLGSGGQISGDSTGRATGTVTRDSEKVLESAQGPLGALRSPAASPRTKGAQPSRGKGGLAPGDSLNASTVDAAGAGKVEVGSVPVDAIGGVVVGAGQWGGAEGMHGADGVGVSDGGVGSGVVAADQAGTVEEVDAEVGDVGTAVEGVDFVEEEGLEEHGWRCVEVLCGVLHMSHCVVRSEEGNGLVARGSAAALVEMCHVSHCGLHGVSAVDGALVDAYGCKVSSNALSGCNAVGRGACVRCRSCEVLDNEDAGLNVLQGALALTSASQLSANRGTGVRAVGEGSWAVQTDCTIASNGWHGVSALQGGSALVDRSSLTLNMGAGVNAFSHGHASVSNCHLLHNRFGVWSQNGARVLIDRSATGPSREGNETSLDGGVILHLPSQQDVAPQANAAAAAAAVSQ
jgi:hypothetical protein